MFLVLVFLLVQPAESPAETLQEIQRDMAWVAKTAKTIEARQRGAKPETLQLDEEQSGVSDANKAPWAMRAAFGLASWMGPPRPSVIPPTVLPSSPLRFTLLPTMLLGPAQVSVEVCRGSQCRRVTWPWQCSKYGGCDIDGTASVLLGEDGGRHLVTLTLTATATGPANKKYEQRWEFEVAPALVKLPR